MRVWELGDKGWELGDKGVGAGKQGLGGRREGGGWETKGGRKIVYGKNWLYMVGDGRLEIVPTCPPPLLSVMQYHLVM